MKYAHYIIELAALMTGLFVAISFRKGEAHPRKSVVMVLVFVVLIFVSVTTDAVMWYMAEHKLHNWYIFQVYILIETVILLLFLQFIIAGNKPNSKGAYLLFLNIGLVLAWVALNIVGEKFGQYATRIAAVFGGVLAVVGMAAFANLRLVVLRSQLFKTPETWFIFGIIVYHTTTCFLFASVEMFTTPEAQQKLLVLWGILQAPTSIVKHCSYIYGFYLCRKTLPS